MKRRARFYLGRFDKYGHFTDEKFIKALAAPTAITAGKHAWTITGYKEAVEQHKTVFAYGRLTKFKPEGRVVVVDREKRQEVERLEENLIIASSPFIYIPAHAAIAYAHCWNEIEQPVFVDRFCDIIRTTYENFFVDCQIEPISDLRSFAKKLQALGAINEITATVRPPNPLFGPLWGPLRDYIRKRSASEIKISEKASLSKPLRSNLKKLIHDLLKSEADKPYVPSEQPDIGDAALLMAADGYGHGKVVGEHDGEEAIILTSQAIKSFLFDKEPEPARLYERTIQVLEAIEKERHLGHQ